MNPPATDVFVYGTLKPGEANYLAYHDRVIEQIPVYTWGDLYALPVGYPAMTPGKNQVYGVCLRFEDARVLESLDLLEDYQEQRTPDLNEYYRALTPIYRPNHQLVGQAWAYFMTRDRVMRYGGVKVASGWWSGI